MGPVFRAYDPEAERLVAVKLFRLDLPPERIHQLVAEFEQVIEAGLRHPAIATPVATGIVEASAYLALEYFPAESLDTAVRERGALPVAEALEVAANLAAALDFASAVGVDHGGLHPRDLLLTGEHAKLTGHGVVRALERAGASTPVRRPYTAPERISGTEWGHRADIFSLAALVHEMLWARRLSGMGAAAGASLGVVAGGDLEMLRAVFARALDEDPQARFASAREFVEALSAAFGVAPMETAAGASAPLLETPTMLEMFPSEADVPLTTADDPTTAPDEPTQVVEEIQEATLIMAPPVAPDPVFVSEVELPPSDPEPPTVVTEPPPAAISEPVAATEAEPVNRRAHVRQARRAPRLSTIDRPPLDADRGPAPDSPDLRLPLDSPAAAHELELRQAPPAPPPAQFESEQQTLPGNWPLAFALAIGIAVGFAAGYGVGMRGRSTPAPVAAVAVPTPQPDAPPKTPAPKVAETLPPAQNPAPAARPPAASAKAPAAAPTSAPRTPPPSASRTSPPPAPVAAATSAGTLVVRSTPSGAKVTVDGKDYGRTPVTIRALTRGPHRVQVARDGFVTEERRLTIASAQSAQSVAVRLTRARPGAAAAGRKSADAAATEPAAATASGARGTIGSLVVESRPPGASVYLDGRLVGTTPVSVPGLPAGEHSIRLDHEGFRTWSSSIRIDGSEMNRVTASLEK